MIPKLDNDRNGKLNKGLKKWIASEKTKRKRLDMHQELIEDEGLRWWGVYQGLRWWGVDQVDKNSNIWQRC